MICDNIKLIIHFELYQKKKGAFDNEENDETGDGKITAADARTTLRASVSLDKLNTWQNSASNVDKTAENKITAADARFILRASVGLEKFSEWIKTLK